MKSFPITAWSVKYNNLYPGEIEKIAVVYVNPTENLIKSINNRQLIVPVSISGTQSAYDGITCYGTLVPSAQSKSYVPTSSGTPNSIMILLNTEWDSYPLYKGEVNIDLPDDEEQVVVEENRNNETRSMYLMDMNFAILLGILLVVTIVILMKK